jgi:hypothetical protein
VQRRCHDIGSDAVAVRDSDRDWFGHICQSDLSLVSRLECEAIYSKEVGTSNHSGREVRSLVHEEFLSQL